MPRRMAADVVSVASLQRIDRCGNGFPARGISTHRPPAFRRGEARMNRFLPEQEVLKMKFPWIRALALMVGASAMVSVASAQSNGHSPSLVPVPKSGPQLTGYP